MCFPRRLLPTCPIPRRPAKRRTLPTLIPQPQPHKPNPNPYPNPNPGPNPNSYPSQGKGNYDYDYPIPCAATLYGNSYVVKHQASPSCEGSCEAGKYCGMS